MVALNELPAVVMAFVVGGLILGAGALALSAFSTSLTAGSVEKMAVLNATSGVGSVAQQLPTVGTIVGVALIIFVVIGAFAGGLRHK